MQSPSWDGRYGLVVMGDIAVYEPGPARPTGGVGVTALLIGPDAPIVIDPYRASHFENVYDFYKPNLNSEYPAVDGHLSISCYYRSLDGCYEGYRRRFKVANRREFDLQTDVAYSLFHSPFTKLVRKSYARLFQNDFILRDKKEGLGAKGKIDKEWKKLTLEETYTHTDIQKEFSSLTEELYEQRVVPSLLLSRQLGNSYTGSLYASLASLIATQSDQQLAHKKALLFSYGSGSAATMFSASFNKPVDRIREQLDLQNRLEHRRSVTSEEYLETMKLREKVHSLADYTPEQSVDDLFPGAYYLEQVDKKKRRTYQQKKID
jgi:hydroxymethylglutaryl-CoA synthase